jgi:thiosulfate/3-mercaptopyruvate sulfurtransferase
VNSNILVSVAELEALLGGGRCVVVDCRFEMSNPGKGRVDWLAGHIPGAAYAHLDNDLSSPIGTGRHPLPDPSISRLARRSAGRRHALVAYDEGSMRLPPRLWWLMKYFGQRAALDGGWRLGRGRIFSSPAHRSGTRPPAGTGRRSAHTVDASAITAAWAATCSCWTRAPANDSAVKWKPDSRAGHIPGANRPFGSNGARGRFGPQERARSLRRCWETGYAEVVHPAVPA